MSIVFHIDYRLAGSPYGRAGTIFTPHGPIATPAFIPVATKATVKTVLPEAMREIGAQALLSNAYHLFLQPGPDIVDAAGGLAAFMNWHGPTYTDSGGFQVLSLGSGFKKVLEMEIPRYNQKTVVPQGDKLATVMEEGVRFRSHISGAHHMFTPEVSMSIQHSIGADIIFTFDELTALADSRSCHESSVERTYRWAQRCLHEHTILLNTCRNQPSLWGVIQGANYEDLRKTAAQGLVELSVKHHDITGIGFEGYGIGGALEKQRIGQIISWVNSVLPEQQPRHLLGISEPDDLFAAIESGADTFDCVMPSRIARSGSVYTFDGRINLKNARFRRDYSSIEPQLTNYSSQYSRAYLHHLFKAKEITGMTIATIHNEHFILQLVDSIRSHIIAGSYWEFKTEFLNRYFKR